MEASESGAAALASVLGFYGRFVALEELRLACGVSRDGASAGNLVKVAGSYGLQAQMLTTDVDGLAGLPLPMIVFWNFNHFVVLEGFGKQVAYLNDPALGPRTVTLKEFDQSFTGMALVFEPGVDFKPGGERPNPLWALRKRLAGTGSAIAYIVLANLALVLLALVLPSFTRIFVDEFLIRGAQDVVVPLLAGMSLTAVVYALLTWFQQGYLLRLETRLTLHSSSIFFWHILRLPTAFFTQRSAGEIGSRVAINDQ
jgi:ABC-type bacteriocin/lantibiotic exporter with double-glycine peptidase domain